VQVNVGVPDGQGWLALQLGTQINADSLADHVQLNPAAQLASLSQVPKVGLLPVGLQKKYPSFPALGPTA